MQMRMIVNAMYHKSLLRLSNRDFGPVQGGGRAGEFGPIGWLLAGWLRPRPGAASRGRPAGSFDQVEADLHLVVDHVIPFLIADAEIGARNLECTIEHHRAAGLADRHR